MSMRVRGEGTGPASGSLAGIRPGRLAAGIAVAVVVPAVLQWMCLEVWNADLTAASLLQLTGAVAAALVGGIVPGMLAAFWASLLLNYFMVAPTGSLFIHDARTVVSLGCFAAVSGAVALVVHLAERRLAVARRAREEAAVLTRLTTAVVAAQDPVSSLLEQSLEVFGADGAALFIRPAEAGGGPPWDRAWTRRAAAGQAPATPAEAAADTVEQVEGRIALVLRGAAPPAGRRNLLRAFTAQLAAVLDRQQLAASLDENRMLVRDNKMRTSILQAVSHDLRTPLAGIKLATSSLLQPEARFDETDRQELLGTVEAYVDRLSVMVENLLDFSRIAGDAVGAVLGPVQWQDVMPGALRGVPPGSVELRGVTSAAPVVADAGLLERVVANLAENAARHAPGSRIVLVASGSGLAAETGAEAVGADGGGPGESGRAGFGELRVVDTGAESAAPLPEDLEELFVPFQRFGDAAGPGGTGLGLAVARGLTEAMGGTLTAQRTPGGGLTMVVRLRRPGSAQGSGVGMGARPAVGPEPAADRRRP
jgi:two-component system, OmpR family, sensor histidine kinase KdpD